MPANLYPSQEIVREMLDSAHMIFQRASSNEVSGVLSVPPHIAAFPILVHESILKGVSGIIKSGTIQTVPPVVCTAIGNSQASVCRTFFCRGALFRRGLPYSIDSSNRRAALYYLNRTYLRHDCPVYQTGRSCCMSTLKAQVRLFSPSKTGVCW